MWRLLGLCAASLCVGVAQASVVNKIAPNLYQGVVNGRVVGKYFLIDTPMSWGAAYKTCMDRNSQLVTLRNPAAADVIKELMSDGQIVTAWIGLHDKFEPNEYVTQQDEDLATIGFRTWQDGYPMGDADGLRECVGLEVGTSSSGLVDLDCSEVHQAFCEEPLWSDYVLIPELGYYKYHAELLSWPQAWDKCREEGAHLVIINSAAEMDALFTLFAHTYSWVGVNQVFYSGEFVSVFNDALEDLGYSTWGSFPDLDNVNFPYVSIYQNWGLFSEQFDRNLQFICEHSLY